VLLCRSLLFDENFFLALVAGRKRRGNEAVQFVSAEVESSEFASTWWRARNK
jgi:hypothetical protein